MGREQRLFTAAQRAALAVRDGGCLWPGCTRPASWSEAHHLNGWSAAEGLTNLDDGILLCARDHLRLHNDGWQINRQRTQYWLTPPQKLDPARTPILLQSKAALRLQSPLRLRT